MIESRSRPPAASRPTNPIQSNPPPRRPISCRAWNHRNRLSVAFIGSPDRSPGQRPSGCLSGRHARLLPWPGLLPPGLLHIPWPWASLAEQRSIFPVPASGFRSRGRSIPGRSAAPGHFGPSGHPGRRPVVPKSAKVPARHDSARPRRGRRLRHVRPPPGSLRELPLHQAEGLHKRRHATQCELKRPPRSPCRVELPDLGRREHREGETAVATVYSARSCGGGRAPCAPSAGPSAPKGKMAQGSGRESGSRSDRAGEGAPRGLRYHFAVTRGRSSRTRRWICYDFAEQLQDISGRGTALYR
ncbi:hypothetical protein DFJ74DRAFT_9531 [Hyaloraphidium curvatum]|nr:hypothetical protein DFJ74DRAFT_9531 [Hyaloraphidium curvatum]